MKRTAANVDETSSDDERYYAMIKGVDEFAKHWRASKVNRSTDDRTAWSRCGWAGHVAAKLRENSWHEYYHMPVVCFDLLHSMLYTESEEEREMARIKALNSTPMGAIETHVKLASTLRQLFGEKRKSMVDVFKISDTSARAAFSDVIRRINACSALDGDIFTTKQDYDTLLARANAFASRSAYPTIFRHAVGAIDGLFIKTEQPEAKEVGNVRQYWSGHKKGYGINMQGICDAQCRFIGFSCNTAGSTNDYVAFRHSFCYGLWPTLPAPFYYLGDCAYPLSPVCLTPFVGTSIVKEQDTFNFYHSQLRITIERAFGILVGVFGIFHTPLTFSIATSCEVVEACVRLHNFRINQGCQNVTRKPSAGAVFREAFDRSQDVFDILDDVRYVTDRPHATDAAYAQYVVNQERNSGPPASTAEQGKQRRQVIAHALLMAGAERPQ
jgi:hypothetical protein